MRHIIKDMRLSWCSGTSVYLTVNATVMSSIPREYEFINFFSRSGNKVRQKGHVERMSESRTLKSLLSRTLDGRRNRGRPKLRCVEWMELSKIESCSMNCGRKKIEEESQE